MLVVVNVNNKRWRYMTNARIDVYISLNNFWKLEKRRNSTSFKGYSAVVDDILTDYFRIKDNQEAAVQKLQQTITSICMEKDNKIQNLEYEVRQLKGDKKE